MAQEKSVDQLILDRLKAAGIEAHFPGQHVGACTSNYVVVKYGGSARKTTLSTDYHLYDLMCYVPANRPSQLAPFVDTVKGALKPLFPMIKPTGQQTPAFPDDTNKSYMVSAQYINYRLVQYT